MVFDAGQPVARETASSNGSRSEIRLADFICMPGFSCNLAIPSGASGRSERPRRSFSMMRRIAIFAGMAAGAICLTRRLCGEDAG